MSDYECKSLIPVTNKFLNSYKMGKMHQCVQWIMSKNNDTSVE